MEFDEAFKTVFGFDILNFKNVYHNTRLGVLFRSLCEARDLKQALNVLKEKFGWKENFVIYRHGGRGFSVDTENKETDVEDVVKVE